MENNIKLIAMDFDWTLVDHSGEAPSVNIELLDWFSCFIKDGKTNQAGIISGRPIWEMKDYLNSVYSWGNPFPSFCVYRESYFATVKNSIDSPAAEKNASSKASVSSLMQCLAGKAQGFIGLLGNAGLTITNWNVYGDFALEFHLKNQTEAQTAMEMLKTFLADEKITGVSVHRNGIMATVIAEQCGKGNMLEYASGFFDIPPSQILAFGDSLNDLSMLDGEKGFIAGTVENADEIVKQTVNESNGYIGKGVASNGIKNVILSLIEEGRLKDYLNWL